jgi:drug/metabolite transporter (DMT)-like permease
MRWPLGDYQVFCLLALDLEVTPGVMATIMGVQPILTVVLVLVLVERQRSWSRMFGLALGLTGLIMVVYQGIGLAGMLFGLLALASMTFGSDVNIVCFDEQGFILPELWMGLVVSEPTPSRASSLPQV